MITGKIIDKGVNDGFPKIFWRTPCQLRFPAELPEVARAYTAARFPEVATCS